MDPQATPPSGDSVVDLIARIGDWLHQQAAQSGRIIAIAPANCLRAAVIHCLQAPPTAFRQIDVPPLSSIFLSSHQGQWRLRVTPL
jgi:broad specificity phosphatase PhoE